MGAKQLLFDDEACRKVLSGVEQFKRGDFSGVHPVILNIAPISNMLPLLGLKEEEGVGQLAKV